MRSLWIWIIGGFFVLYILSDADSGGAQRVREQDYRTSPSGYTVPSYQVDTSNSFRGYECLSDCSGHEAGYEWAEEQGIDDPDDCDGNSQSFIEGCQAYAEEQQDAEDF